MEECIAIVYYHSFLSAVMLILILCKDYGYCECHLNPVQPGQSYTYHHDKKSKEI